MLLNDDILSYTMWVLVLEGILLLLSDYIQPGQTSGKNEIQMKDHKIYIIQK